MKNELERELTLQQWLNKYNVGSGYVKPTEYYYFPDWGTNKQHKSFIEKFFDLLISKLKF